VKRVALAAAVSLATLTVAVLLWRFRDAALLLMLSVVVAAAARPAIDGLESRLGRSLAVTLTLITFSCYSLKMPWDCIAFFGVVVTVMTFALNGLALGLGVLYPNFRESNPSKIVSGFGGTFCFVVSFLYILISVLLLAFGSAVTRRHLPSQGLALAGITLFILLSAALGWLPLKFSLSRLRQFEA